GSTRARPGSSPPRSAARRWGRSSSSRPTPATSASAEHFIRGGMAVGRARPAGCVRGGMNNSPPQLQRLLMPLDHDDLSCRRVLEGGLFLIGFGACVPLANWLVQSVGTTCVPNGPCLIPVAPGLTAPSGVLMVGLALVLRDLVQRRLGLGWSVAAIIIGAALSASFAPPALGGGPAGRVPLAAGPGPPLSRPP